METPHRLDVPSKRTVTLNVEENLDKRTSLKSKPKEPSKRSLFRCNPVLENRFVTFLSGSQTESLRTTASWLVRPGFGILAADDTKNQIDSKLENMKLFASNLNRYKYNEVFLGGGLELGDFLSGILMREESISTDWFRGKKLVQLIKERQLKLGIRLDKGVTPLAGTHKDFTTQGLDQLEEDCKRVKDMGAEFTLWRSVYRISDVNPSTLAIQQNSRTLARFAVVCQKHGLVPILSVDVLPDGNYSATQAQTSLKQILTSLVKMLSDYHVFWEGILIRMTAATQGICCCSPEDLVKVAVSTAEALTQCLPPALGGVLMAREDNFTRSLIILEEMQHCRFRIPFFVSFCYSRIIQNDVIDLWAGKDKNLKNARIELMKRLKCCSLATFGQCSRKPKTMFVTTEFVPEKNQLYLDENLQQL